MPPKKAASAAPARQGLPAAAGIGYHLREAYRAFSRDFHARLARYGITHAQWLMLWFLSQAGSLTPLELSQRAGIKKASATSVIDALKKRKLIRGDQDIVDRRKINLHLTPSGLDLMQDLRACAAAANADARASFSDKEMETLLRLLRGIVSNLEAKGPGTV